MERVAPVDDDVSLFEEWRELAEDGVDRRARFHEEDHLAGTFESRHERHEIGVSLDWLAGGFPCKEVICHRGSPVVDGDSVVVVGEIEYEILAHYGQSDEADVG